MAQFIPFPNVVILNLKKPHIIFGVVHHRSETLIQGCRRVADKYRVEESSIDKFFINNNGKIELDFEGLIIYV
jgi:hypothetical protein